MDSPGIEHFNLARVEVPEKFLFSEPVDCPLQSKGEIHGLTGNRTRTTRLPAGYSTIEP